MSSCKGEAKSYTSLLAFWCFIVFLILKLCGTVSWEWGYILLPASFFLGAVARQAEIQD